MLNVVAKNNYQTVINILKMSAMHFVSKVLHGVTNIIVAKWTMVKRCIVENPVKNPWEPKCSKLDFQPFSLIFFDLEFDSVVNTLLTSKYKL